MRLKFLVACAIASLVIGTGWGASAFAYGPNAPYVTVNSSIVDPGQSLTVDCGNFAPHESIIITLSNNHSVFLGKTYTNRKGSCSLTVTIPSNTTPGTYTIVATGKSGDTASTDITVVVPKHQHHHGHYARYTNHSDHRYHSYRRGNHSDQRNHGVYWDSVWSHFFD